MAKGIYEVYGFNWHHAETHITIELIAPAEECPHASDELIPRGGGRARVVLTMNRGTFLREFGEKGLMGRRVLLSFTLAEES